MVNWRRKIFRLYIGVWAVSFFCLFPEQEPIAEAANQVYQVQKLLLGKSVSSFHARVSERTPEELAVRDFMSVCPPFFLRDEQGNIIDPVHGINDNKPYSPKQTCGVCHDYDLITSAYHFQQGKNEGLEPELAAVYPWMRSPGQYGGRY